MLYVLCFRLSACVLMYAFPWAVNGCSIFFPGFPYVWRRLRGVVILHSQSGNDGKAPADKDSDGIYVQLLPGAT